MDEKKIKIENFIGIYDNFIPPIFCDDLINYFENKNKFGKSFDRISSENVSVLKKKDLTVALSHLNINEWFEEFKPFFANVDIAISNYALHTGLKDIIKEKLKYTMFRIQKTLPAEGYHVWHVEQSSGFDYTNRVLAFTVYLNDVTDGGETEFLHQSVRVNPIKGRLVIWPAAFPYVHRGNPPLKGEKYILTSWLLSN